MLTLCHAASSSASVPEDDERYSHKIVRRQVSSVFAQEASRALACASASSTTVPRAALSRESPPPAIPPRAPLTWATKATASAIAVPACQDGRAESCSPHLTSLAARARAKEVEGGCFRKEGMAQWAELVACQ